MKSFLLLGLILSCLRSQAEVTLAPRYEYISAQKELANRGILKAKIIEQKNNFRFFAEGFFEYEGNSEGAYERRSPSRGYLQEAYIEMNFSNVFIKFGQQSLRWSEMWVVPSLDIFTGRRWNRLFFDSVADQLTHSTGVSVSWAGQKSSLESFVVVENAENPLPRPLPPDLDSSNLQQAGGGVRAKFDVGGLSLGFLGASLRKDFIGGVSANYAFESFVPKLEAGMRKIAKEKLVGLENEYQYYTSVGIDLFLGNWVFTPQFTYNDITSPTTGKRSPEYYWYFGGSWIRGKHDLTLQYYKKEQSRDLFAGISYSYFVLDSLGLGGLIQYYDGDPGGLFGTYENMTNDVVLGLRLEWIKSLDF